MTKITKAFLFNFDGRDILKAHLFEHCLASYFFDHCIPFYKAKTHPLGVYILFDKKVPDLPNVSDLETYISNQKKRLNLEILIKLDLRSETIETMHKLYSDKFSDALSKIEGILNLDTRGLMEDFERIFETRMEITNLSARLPKVPTDDSFHPAVNKILIPKLNKDIDVVEIAIRAPQSIENISCLINFNIQGKRKLDELSILNGIVYGLRYNILTLQGGNLYFTYSLKVKAGQGKRALDMLSGLLKDLELEEAAFIRWKGRMIGKTRKNWQANKLTDLLVMELILWRRVLKPEDFEDLHYQTILDLHKKTFSKPNNIYFLTDF